MENKETFSVSEAAAIIGLSVSGTYQLVKEGRIPAVRFGRRIVVTRKALAELLHGAPAANAK